MYIKNYFNFILEKESGKGEPNEELYNRWKKLINMTASELQKFI